MDELKEYMAPEIVVLEMDDPVVISNSGETVPDISTSFGETPIKY